jgi:hypothetical protein
MIVANLLAGKCVLRGSFPYDNWNAQLDWMILGYYLA